MLTEQVGFLDFIAAERTQLVVPVYQRVYAWNALQCDTLYRDALRAGRTGGAHFIGTVLFAPEEPGENGIARADIIDGQQRAATVTLLLAALRDHLEETKTELDSLSAADISRRFLHVDGNPASRKLLLGRVDDATLRAVIEKEEPPQGDDLSANVVETYERFREKMRGEFTVEDAQNLMTGLRRLYIVAAKLEDDDRAQLIFESLNSKGMPLTTGDLVRNLLLVNIEHEEQTRLYETYWEPIERLYADDEGGVRLGAALHGWLAVTAPKLKANGKDDVYPAFKTYLEDMHEGTLEELLIGLSGFCRTFAARSQASSASRNLAHDSWGDGKVRGIISEKKLFGE